MSISDPMKRLQVIQTPALRGWTVELTCVFYGVSPATFYVWQARFNEGGVEGLRERSRRPQTSPTQITGDVEAKIVAMRRTHPSWGAQRIRDELRLARVSPPAVSTIHQVLVRKDLVEPVRSPDKATGRFERPCPNDLWQIDATEWELADHTIVQIIDLIDDHSRVVVASRAWPGLSEDFAWDTLQGAIDEYGPPRQLLSDNARWLTGRPYQAVIEFERRCWRLHIDTIQARLYHPRPWASSNANTAPSRTGCVSSHAPTPSPNCRLSSTPTG